ncbi:MAG: hypothetical protein FJZ87_03745, partial [Chloroflexi bacterium]|nr:hypothetical protein [Chloroflexota bacterium]
MRWVDGSTLVSAHLNTPGAQPQRLWVYRDDVNGYMFNLCIEAGVCAAGWHIPNPSVDSPSVSAEHQQAYCQWAGGGRALSAEKLTQVLDDGFFTSVPDNGAVVSVLDNGFIPNDLSMGFRCVVEHPTPQPEFCQTSAYYGNGLPEEMDESATKAGDFCQNGQSYVTFDLTLPENASIDSFSTNCQSAGGNRVVCSSNGSDIKSEAWVQIRCDMMGPDFACPTGFDLSSDGGALCTYNGGGITSIHSPHLASLDLNQLFDPPAGGCPIGTYYDPVRDRCVSVDTPPASRPVECVDGYDMDESRQCCVSNLPSGNYPGCPIGIAIDPATGACDFERVCSDNATAFEKIDLNPTFPSCF